MVTQGGETQQALGAFRTAMALKPGFVEAEREVRLLTTRDAKKKKSLSNTLLRRLRGK